ncbi:MAG: VOC family protein [Myxococcota bacterium]
MVKTESLGIKKLEALHYYVRDLERSRAFYTGKLDFAEVAKSSDELETRGGQRSLVFEAGACRVLCSQPLTSECRAARWLQRHPDGVGALIFEVEDIERTFALLDRRGGTPIDEIQTLEDEFGSIRTFSITTPFGSSTFRFIQRSSYQGLMPGIDRYEQPLGGVNTFGFQSFDHVTSNFETMSPTLLWLEHVLGFESYWDIEFHTNDVMSFPQDGATQENGSAHQKGSGLRSRVMWDPVSGVKFANNEPMRPQFQSSQINVFYEDQRGDGIQHAAIAAKDILSAVRGLKGRGVRFFPTPSAYYEMLPGRIDSLGIGSIDESIDELKELEVLVDGNGERSYLLQIFLEDSAGTHDDASAGPFFFEVIQRKGDQGFGGGNFRALFESIERQQQQGLK